MQFWTKLLEVVATAKTGLLLSLSASGFVVWQKEWPLQWVSDAGLVLLVACSVSLLWQFKEWAEDLIASYKDKRWDKLYNIRTEVDKIRRRLVAEGGGRMLLQSRYVSGELQVLYSKLSGLGIPTPPAPQPSATWSSAEHIAFLDTVRPYLSGPSLRAGKKAAERFLLEARR